MLYQDLVALGAVFSCLGMGLAALPWREEDRAECRSAWEALRRFLS
jgi:hypothetical protein